MKRLLGLVIALLLLVGCASVAEPVGADANPPEVTAATEPTVAATALPAPREWSGVPQAYWAVLERLFACDEASYGYQVVDINNDGIPELILFILGSTELPWLFQIYTLDGDEPAHLIHFDIFDFGVITKEGIIFAHHTRSEEIATIRSFLLEADATTLTTLTSHRFFYENLDDEQLALLHAYRNPPNPMQFEFIPLGS
ncbi:MAG: hypothetical protein FWB76_02650 [Oscillospiraceae bacterium]|nr:hypothetical protein [Oscillospiraceae bacterium]